MEIHDPHQIEEAFLQWDVGDVSGPHLINRGELAGVHQAGESQGWIAWNRDSGFLVDRLQTPAAHKVSDTVVADRDPFSGQLGDQPPTATAGIFQVEGIDPGHDPQRRFTHRN